MSKTRARYPSEFRQQMVELIRAGRSPEERAREFEPSAQAIRAYVRHLGAVPLPSTPLIRTRRCRPYTKDRLTRDCRAMLREAGIPDDVQLRDLRRTVTTEEAKAGATAAEMTAGRGWSHRTGVKMQDTYVPTTFDMAKAAKDKRRRNKK